jgi:hypothetical protein
MNVRTGRTVQYFVTFLRIARTSRQYRAFALIPQGTNSIKAMAAMLVFQTKESN